jgi:hypothetical protein
MNVKRIEFILFATLVIGLVLRLKDAEWIEPVIYLNTFALISVWVYGLIKNQSLVNAGYTKLELFERLFILFLLSGIIMNVSNISGSPIIIACSVTLLIIFQVVKGVIKLIKADIPTGIESIIISLLLFGYLFRFMYWPFSGPLMVVFSTILCKFYIGYGIYFSTKLSKQSSVIGIIGMFLYWVIALQIMLILFDAMSWPGTVIFLYPSLLITVTLIPVLIYQLPNIRKLSENLKSLVLSLYKKLTIVISISLFMTAASQQQFLKFIFGNRTRLIESHRDCRLVNNPDKSIKQEKCYEYEVLWQLTRTGQYKEGMNDEELESIKKSYYLNEASSR